MQITMVVHGGSWNTMPDDAVDAHALGCLSAVERGFQVLQNGASAVDAVEIAIRLLEDDPTFDAGHGSFPTQDGKVELDAALMDGSTLDVGAVACVVGIPQPIQLARLVLESPQILLAGEGARQFAIAHKLPTCSCTDLMAPEKSWNKFSASRSYQGKSDTVGAVALDSHGNIAAGLSTGGQPDRISGRVGDVPLVGCGFYANNEVGAIACSGLGEAIARVGLANRAMHLLERGMTAQWAADRAIQYMQNQVGGFAGILVVDPTGDIGISFNSYRFARAYLKQGMQKPFVAVDGSAWKKPGDSV